MMFFRFFKSYQLNIREWFVQYKNEDACPNNTKSKTNKKKNLDKTLNASPL